MPGKLHARRHEETLAKEEGEDEEEEEEEEEAKTYAKTRGERLPHSSKRPAPDHAQKRGIMEAAFWTRVMGFVICMALSLDVRRTVEAIPVRRTRLMVGGIVVALQAMNILSILTEIFAALICPVVIQLFGLAYYGAKCMTAFMCAIRVELATATLMNGKRTARLVTRALKLFVTITFILNMGKALFVYRSFETEAGCAVDFGGGIWPILDDICFMTLDLATFIGLLLHYRTMNSITQTAKNHTIISDAFFRILWISVIPLLSTLSITIQVLLDPSTAYFVGAMDFQVHMICMYLVYSWRRQSCELRSSLYRGGAPSKRILSGALPPARRSPS